MQMKGRSSYHISNRGFTLLEILVAMVIISLVIGISMFMIGDNRTRYLDHESRRFLAVMQMAADEAVLQFSQLGVVLDNKSYRFVVFDEAAQAWIPYTKAEDQTYRDYELPFGMFLEVDLDGVDAGLRSSIEELTLIDEDELNRFEEEEEDARLQPQIFLFSSGEISDFDVYFRYDDLNAFEQVRGRLNGVIERVDEP
jgi:general secretion pathway protein H